MVDLVKDKQPIRMSLTDWNAIQLAMHDGDPSVLEDRARVKAIMDEIEARPENVGADPKRTLIET
jgi:hypothetical protein